MPSLWVEGAGTVQSVSLGEPQIRLQSSSVPGVELSALSSEDDDASASLEDAAPPPAAPAATVSPVAAPARRAVAAMPTATSPTVATGFRPEVPRMRPRTPPARLAVRVPPATVASSEQVSTPIPRNEGPLVPRAKPRPPVSSPALSRSAKPAGEPTDLEEVAPRTPLKAKPVSVAAAPAPGVGKGDRRVVQVAASGQGQRAKDLATELRRKGFDSYVIEVQDDPSGLRYKVRVRPQSGEVAQALVERLRRGGRDGWITTQ